MRLLFLNSAKDWGGNEKWTYLAAKSLSENHDVYLAYRKKIFGNRFDFEIEKFKLPFLFEFDLFAIYRIISIINKKQIDILIPTKRKEYVLAGVAARICGKKNIIRLGIVRALRNRWYNNFVYNMLADGIIVNAERIKSVLMKSKFIDGDKVKVIYNGLDIDVLSQAIVTKDFEKNCSFLISSMGRITGRKGFEHLIRGFGHFINTTKTKDAKLLLIGEGEKLSALKKLAKKLELGDKIIFSGFLKNPYSYLAESDVFVLISENEGISNALLEGMYFKNAVITTAAGGVKEVIEHGKNGYLIDDIDIIKLGEIIKELYQCPEKRKNLGEEAHQTVIKKFSMEKMKNEIEAYFDEIL